MYICCRCDAPFDTPDTERCGGGDLGEERNVCPVCGSDDIEEAKHCPVCGNDVSSDAYEPFVEACKKCMKLIVKKGFTALKGNLTEAENALFMDYFDIPITEK